MPTYDYECTKCSHEFEAFQQMSDKLLTKCPKCGAKLKRLIGSGAGIIFKGSGFYATDYKKSSKDAPSEKPKSCPKMKEGCNGCQHSH
jgi:putative FmdB family regulatory protein